MSNSKTTHTTQNVKAKTSPKTNAPTKLWQKEGQLALPEIESYTVGEDYIFDNALMPYDIIATKSHVKSLEKIGILSMEEMEEIIEQLIVLEGIIEKKGIMVTVHDEDCHTVIENFLVDKLGKTGKKVHTGRSRNDQVLVAVRLYMKDHVQKIHKEILYLAKSFLKQAKKHEQVPLPGYSHTQQAMLSSVGHYLASFVESLIDDAHMLELTLDHIDKNPLGSAAGFGVSFPLDRAYTTKDLKFKQTQINSLYCQTSRGKFESLILEGLVQTMLTLSRFAHDLLFFTAEECQFFTFNNGLTTGSSIMPHKKNHDALEILRSNTSVVIGNQHTIQNISHKLISGYNRDLQLIKKMLFESIQIVESSIAIAYLYIEGLKPNQKQIEQTICLKIFMADTANSLVKESNIPFREAYLQATKLKTHTNVNFKQNIEEKISLGAPGNLGLSHYENVLKKTSQQ